MSNFKLQESGFLIKIEEQATRLTLHVHDDDDDDDNNKNSTRTKIFYLTNDIQTIKISRVYM
jgi:phosphotransferase system IIB component